VVRWRGLTQAGVGVGPARVASPPMATEASLATCITVAASSGIRAIVKWLLRVLKYLPGSLG
jgi:hypothetical protein